MCLILLCSFSLRIRVKTEFLRLLGVSRRENENQFQVPEQLKLVFIISFSLTCCVWPFLICFCTNLEPFGHHSSTCLAGFPGRVLHKKCIIPSMQRHFQASLVFSKPSKINQTWVSQISSKFPDFEVNTKCTNLPGGVIWLHIKPIPEIRIT